MRIERRLKRREKRFAKCKANAAIRCGAKSLNSNDYCKRLEIATKLLERLSCFEYTGVKLFDCWLEDDLLECRQDLGLIIFEDSEDRVKVYNASTDETFTSNQVIGKGLCVGVGKEMVTISIDENEVAIDMAIGGFSTCPYSVEDVEDIASNIVYGVMCNDISCRGIIVDAAVTALCEDEHKIREYVLCRDSSELFDILRK